MNDAESMEAVGVPWPATSICGEGASPVTLNKLAGNVNWEAAPVIPVKTNRLV